VVQFALFSHTIPTIPEVDCSAEWWHASIAWLGRVCNATINLYCQIVGISNFLQQSSMHKIVVHLGALPP
jgi:hypothetical protein